MNTRRFRTPLLAAAVAVAYYGGAQLGFVLRFPPAITSVIWPPNSLLTAVLLLTPPAALVDLPRRRAARPRPRADGGGVPGPRDLRALRHQLLGSAPGRRAGASLQRRPRPLRYPQPRGRLRVGRRLPGDAPLVLLRRRHHLHLPRRGLRPRPAPADLVERPQRAHA